MIMRNIRKSIICLLFHMNTDLSDIGRNQQKRHYVPAGENQTQSFWGSQKGKKISDKKLAVEVSELDSVLSAGIFLLEVIY